MSALTLPPSPVRVARSAFRAGGLVSVLPRLSHSFRGWVLVCQFCRFSGAARLASVWSRRLGVSVVVRSAGSGWAVSVPFAWRSSHWPAGSGFAWPVAGGVRGLRGSLAPAGLGLFFWG